MAGKKLARNTTVAGRTYLAGSVPPDDVADLITNPKAWEAEAGSSNADGPPPQSGKGSGVEAWRNYAADNEVVVGEDATREEIIAELDAAGVPTGSDDE